MNICKNFYMEPDTFSIHIYSSVLNRYFSTAHIINPVHADIHSIILKHFNWNID